MQKTLCFQGCEILSIDINYPKLDNKKIDKFYDTIAKSFLDFCESKLYKNAAEIFLQAVEAGDLVRPREIFYASIKHEIKNENEHIKIYLDIDINGIKTRKVHIWSASGELIKPAKSSKAKAVLTPTKSKKTKVKKKFRFLAT